MCNLWALSETFDFSFSLYSLNLIWFTLIRMLRFGSSSDVLLSAAPRSFVVSLPCPEAGCLRRDWLPHLILMSVYYPSINEWHAASVWSSLFSHHELPIYSHFEFRRVYPASLNRVAVPHDYVPDARGASIMCDRSILWVRCVYWETWLIRSTRRLLLQSQRWEFDTWGWWWWWSVLPPPLLPATEMMADGVKPLTCNNYYSTTSKTVSISWMIK